MRHHAKRVVAVGILIAATVMPFRTRDRAPGEKFHYASAETQVLGLVLRAATRKPLADYVSEKIWQPMGVLRGLRGQGVFVDPQAKIVIVHTAVEGIRGVALGERATLWTGVVKSLARFDRSH